MAEFELDGDRYRSKPLPPKLQMRVLKRLARIAPALKTGAGVADKLKDGQRPNIDELADVLAPVITAFADMPDDDVEFIIDTALDHTMHSPKGDQRFYRVRDNGVVSNRLNAELQRSVMITYYVIRENFETLFSAVVPKTEAVAE